MKSVDYFLIKVAFICCCLLKLQCLAFIPSPSKTSGAMIRSTKQQQQQQRVSYNNPILKAWGGNDDNKDEAAIEEEARLRIYESRRGQIRSALKAAEVCFHIFHNLCVDLLFFIFV